jgi:hypothetical protein
MTAPSSLPRRRGMTLAGSYEPTYPGFVQILDDNGKPPCDPADACPTCRLFAVQQSDESRTDWLARITRRANAMNNRPDVFSSIGTLTPDERERARLAYEQTPSLLDAAIRVALGHIEHGEHLADEIIARTRGGAT